MEQHIKEFNELVRQYKFVEAIERFYDDNVVFGDNANPTKTGKAALLAAANGFLGSVKPETMELQSQIFKDGLLATVWRYVFIHPQAGKLDFSQLSVQNWKDGKVVQEHHYNGF